jgi:hypothetical protein
MEACCSACKDGKATITLYVTEDGVDEPPVELCASCYHNAYGKHLPPGSGSAPDGSDERVEHLHFTNVYTYHAVDRHGNLLGPATKGP